jgi:hypothetical protein
MTWMIVAGVAALVAAVVTARLVGRALRGRRVWTYWAANALVLVVAIAVLFASVALAGGAPSDAADALWGIGLGLGFGGLAGLRYGFRDMFTAGVGRRS